MVSDEKDKWEGRALIRVFREWSDQFLIEWHDGCMEGCTFFHDLVLDGGGDCDFLFVFFGLGLATSGSSGTSHSGGFVPVPASAIGGEITFLDLELFLKIGALEKERLVCVF